MEKDTIMSPVPAVAVGRGSVPAPAVEFPVKSELVRATDPDPCIAVPLGTGLVPFGAS